MPEFMITLSQDQSRDLQRSIYEMTTQAIEQVKKDAGLSKEWLRKGEMCDYIGISRSTLELWIKDGLKNSVINGVTLISKTAINEYIIEHQN